ncbi:putative NRPS-like protein biosynthetic cluster [Amphichorda felina]
MSLMEIFTTLIFGGCVCVPTEEDRFGAVEEFVNKTGVNTLMLTPSYAKLLDPTSMPSVKILIIGGEAVPSSLVETWNAHVEVYIAYGPTEASIQAAGAKIALGGLAPPSGLIGKPTGCNLWIVKEDNHNELVTMGDTGELLIEGHTLARGYLDDQSKTNTSFVDARISQGSIRRVFKTGDLVRQTTDGNIVFVGRKDTQVKVQGQRFEVTEIEATLSPLLGSGSKLCVDKVESLNSLVAFVSTSMRVSSKDNHADISWDQVKPTLEKIPKIRASLERILPMAMIPSLFIPVTFIPLTTSYKTDRKTLRGLVQDMGSSEVQKLQKLDTSVDKTEPISSSQLALRDLWALVLDRKSETIALDDNFIQLGGNSVTSIRLISAARSRGITLTSSMIFSNPALREQAQKASFSYAEGYQGSIPPFVLLEGRSTELCALAAAVCGLPIEEIDDILPMTISQMRWYGKTLAKPTAWLDQYHFRLPADVDLGRFAKALNSTIQASELLRARSLVTEDKKFFQIIVKFCQVNLVQVHEVLEVYLDRDLNIPMGVGAPLSRYAIVKNPNDDNVFVWTIHHAIYDGYSLSMLLQTIEDAYQGLHPAPFTPFNSYLKETESE